MEDIGFTSSPEFIEYLRRLGISGGGQKGKMGQDAWAQLTYSQPTPIGLLDIGVSGSHQRQPGYSRNGVDALSLGLNRGGDGLGFGVDTDYQGKNPFIEMTFNKRF